jgi:hypothetical protein
VARERSPESSGPIDAAASRLVAHLRAPAVATTEQLERVLNLLRTGTEPRVSEFQTLEQAASGAPAVCLKILSAEVARVLDGLRQVVRRVSPRVLAVAEGIHAEAGLDATAGASEEERRYFSLLRCLLQRTVDLLGATGHLGPVEARVLSRRFRAEGRPSHTTPGDLGRVRKALHRIGGVHLSLPNPGGYLPTVDGGAVLADFVAFQLRPRLTLDKNARVALRALEDQSAQMLAKAPADDLLRTREAGLSHFAAIGLADLFIESGRSGDQARRAEIDPQLQSPPLRRWAEEQARAWEARVRRMP